MREFQRKWEEGHEGFYTSTPFAAIEGLGIENSFLYAALENLDGASIRDLAWIIAHTFSDADIAIRVDDGNYLHVSSPYDYGVALKYRKSEQGTKVQYDKVAFDLYNTSRFVTASKVGGTSVLSLAMIVKNEESVLERAISSVQSLVEDCVIVDTGSTDGTISVISELGLSEFNFEWNDDFGAARDYALNQTNSDWTLHLDADEEFECDAEAFISELAEFVGNVQALFANIYNFNQLELANALSHQMIRLARRVDVTWRGMIHEQLLMRSDLNLQVTGEIRSGHINHYGYTSIGDALKVKGDRNIRIAKAYYEKKKSSQSIVHLARSYVLVGEDEIAEAILEEALRENQIEQPWLPVVYRQLIDSKLSRDGIEAARKYIIEFGSRFPGRADHMAREAVVLAKEGQCSRAISLFESLPIKQVYTGDSTFYRAQIAPMIAKYLGDAGNYKEAISLLLRTMDEAGGVEIHPGTVVDFLEKANIPPLEYYRRIPEARRISVFGLFRQLAVIDPDLGSRFLINLMKSGVHEMVVLATAAEVAKLAHVSLKLEISALLRGFGMEEFCPLVSSADDPITPMPERIAGVFVANGAFRDKRARVIANKLCESMSIETFEEEVELANCKYSLELPSDISEFLHIFEVDLASL
ncbi:MAG: glycosyltransferase family 2 protein [Actinomycetota bacterium]|nr:glycosyltransferase family 2 protein [Actinomycetota bacterium]